MWNDLKAAVRDGIVWGVKIAIAAVIVILSVLALLGDYQIVRERALHGQQAYEYLQQVEQARQKQQQPAPEK